MTISRFIALIAVAVAVTLGGWSVAYWTYRTLKLRRLEPTELPLRSEWAGDPAAACVLLLVGDSRVAHWPLEPPYGWRFVRLGFAGETAANIARATQGAIAAGRADIVVIQAGGNDATAAVFQSAEAREETLARARESVIGMARTAIDAGARQVIVLTLVPPIASEWWRRAFVGGAQSELMLRLGDEIARRAEAGGFGVLDANALFRDASGTLRLDYRADGIHWTAAAYRVLNARLSAMTGPCDK